MNRKTQNNTQGPKIIGIWIFFMVIFIIELLFYTWSRVQCVQLGYELSEAAGKQNDLLLLRNNLKIEIAHLKSPKRITEIAKEQLGLTLPKPNQLIVIP
jgi:cell division protein FtsL